MFVKKRKDMADISEARMNLAAAKRVDPYIKDIRDTATHVALYTFSTVKNEWEKTDIEGALFVYSRTGEPYNGILIMNRLNTNNLIEPITKDLDLQSQQPFLLYKNSRSKIFGIWFYEKEECIRVSALLESLVKDCGAKMKSDKVTVKKNGSVDIFGMLSRAQEDYNMNQVPGQLVTNVPAKENKPHAPQGPDGTSQSVMDFFAKAKGQQKESTTQPPGLFHPQRMVAAIGLPHDTGEAQLKPFLQRLMSNPAHTVEHIEKQQRAVTPQEKSSQSKPLQSPTPNIPNKQVHPFSLSGELKETPPYTGPSLLGLQNVQLDQSPKPVPIDLSNKMSFVHISPSTTTHTHPTHPGSAMVLNRSMSNTNEVTGSGDQGSTKFKFSNKSVAETLQKPVLKTPAMFNVSLKTELKKESGKPNSSRPLERNSLGSSKSATDGVNAKPEPLTRNQLLQAFEYLLRNDPDFMNKLHEAYVKSLTELIP